MSNKFELNVKYLDLLRQSKIPLLITYAATYTISPISVRDLLFTEDCIVFLAAFEGNPRVVRIPYNQVIDIVDEESYVK